MPQPPDYRRLRAWRLAEGLSAETVCARAGISFAYLAALESGRANNPSFAVLLRILAVYGRGPADLLDDDLAGAR